jgi:hypothetical protein
MQSGPPVKLDAYCRGSQSPSEQSCDPDSIVRALAILYIPGPALELYFQGASRL